MKALLIILNLGLALGALWGVSGLFKASEKVVYSTGRDRSTERVDTQPKPTAPKTKTMTTDIARQLTTGNNLFNISRCPDAVAGRGGRSPNTQLTLLGIYKVGPNQGAIIQQSRQVRRSMFNRTTQQQPASTQQFFRIGETLENGYMLKSVGNNTVTLSRNGSPMELQLEPAGKNISSAATQAAQAAANRPRTPAEIQQMMMMGQMRMMQSMMRQQGQISQQLQSGGATSRQRTTGTTRTNTRR